MNGRRVAGWARQAVNGALLGTMAWLFALLLARRGRHAAAGEAHAAELERDHEQRTQAAAATERRRIARELHDVIAHSVSVMTVQAGAARMQLPDHPDRAVPPLMAVEETGRQALAELRRLLGILRENDAPALAPQPGLTDLPALAQASVDVDVSVEGQPRPMPASLNLTAYRIVQEALTNTLKHAGPARVDRSGGGADPPGFAGHCLHGSDPFRTRRYDHANARSPPRGGL